eukprot:TRINITY_DN19199_c0_g1_i1.p1 TRINITY_DN19199_c0_g1~~TRINITY_DN19199_c0_g1_i1.p1  ORF type:complete len:622 (+),score=99.65 TRINITY_DN19199_c0_g1_i1:97-1866(+)
MSGALHSVILSAALLLGAIRPACGNAFLQKFDVVGMAYRDRLSEAEVEKELLEAIRTHIGEGVHGEHLESVQRALAPMWSAMPKNDRGAVEGETARHVLHRFFVQRHGWYIRGLDDAEAAPVVPKASADGGSPVGVLKDKVPGFLLELFKKALNGAGIRLDSLVVLASTIERLIHNEASDRLSDVFRVLELPRDDAIDEASAEASLRTYMIMLVGGGSVPPLSNMTKKRAIRLIERFGNYYPAWNDTQVWLSDLMQTVRFMERDRINPFRASPGFTFDEVLRVAEEASARFGRFQDAECRHLKDTLLEVEENFNGRVRLSEFYKKALDFSNGAYFAESLDYLRSQRTLDETRPGEPRVLVPNYILARGNCLGDTGFYSICCINECESLFLQIERAVAAPRAKPEVIAALVENMQSSTVEAPRQLPETMLRRLKDMATRSGGEVLLHGRLFSQWIHFAFPRECPYPRKASAELPQRVNTSAAVQSLSDIQDYLEALNASNFTDDEAGLPFEVFSHMPEEPYRATGSGLFGGSIADVLDFLGLSSPASWVCTLLPVVAIIGWAEAKRHAVGSSVVTPSPPVPSLQQKSLFV